MAGKLRSTCYVQFNEGSYSRPTRICSQWIEFGEVGANSACRVEAEAERQRGLMSDRREGAFVERSEFCLRALDEIWDNNLRELIEYKIDHNGSVCVPQEYVVNGLNLGKWVNNLCYEWQLKQNGKEDSWLTDERERLLNNLGFVWNVLEAQWLENYEALAEYKIDNNGNVCVPKRYITEEGTKLGVWVSNQRYQYTSMKKGKYSPLTNERICLLNELEFVWKVRG